MKVGRQKIKYVKTESLKPMERPLKKHKDVEALIESFNQFGWTIPILVQRGTNRIVAGHGRWLAAQREGVKTVPVIYKDFSDKEANAYAIVDNRLTEISPWDPEGLEHHVTNLEKEGYDLGWIGLGTKTPGGLPVKEDVAPEKSTAPPKSKPGQIYALGPHRLMCGDATNEADVARLMGGAKVDMIFTDPPYGIKYVGKTKGALTIKNDRLGNDETSALVTDSLRCAPLKEGGTFYVCCTCGDMLFPFLVGILNAGLAYKSQIVWIKDVFVLGHMDYHFRHEGVLYGWKEGAAHYFVDDRKLDTVWEIPRPKRNKEHPTMKPVELVARAMEIDPGYADVVRRRYWAFVNDGEEKGWQEGTPAMTGMA